MEEGFSHGITACHRKSEPLDKGGFAGPEVGVIAAPVAVAPAARNPDGPSTWGTVGRNEACPCGSGKKYKHCHGALA